MNDPAEIEFTDTDIPHALYRLYDAGWILLRVGITRNIPARFEQYKAEAHWWAQVAHRTMVWHPSELEARKAEAEAIDAEKPLHNDLRPAVGAGVPPHGQRRGWHRKPLVGWNAPEGDAAWLRAEAGRRGVTLTVILNEMLAWFRLARAEESGRDQILESMRRRGIAEPPEWWFDDRPEVAAWYRGYKEAS